jgi:glycosyltransferase involved in cell wall biosynthesis
MIKRSPRVAIVGSVGVPANYGGFESLVECLLDYNDVGFEYTVFCSTKAYSNTLAFYKGAKLEYLPLNANGLSSVFYDGLCFLRCLFERYDVIFVLGVSGAIFLPFFRPFLKSKIVCNLDGIEWSRDKWSFFAKHFLKFSEYIAIKCSDIIITDNKGISDYVIEKYRQESVIIAYGAEIRSQTSNFLLKKYNLKHQQYFFKVSRIEPENNVEMILIAFSELKDQTLVFVGNWNNSKFGKTIKRKYLKFENIQMLDPIYDPYTLNELRANCRAYVHGHSAGGTNPSLVEAMGLSLPILAYDVKFNRHTLNNHGFYFSSVFELKNIITETDEKDLQAESEKIFQEFNKNYTKKKIASKYSTLFLKISLN